MAANDDDAAAAAAAAKAAKEKEDAARADAARRAEEARLLATALDEYEQVLIPIVLDKATDSYTKWRGIFITVLGKYALTRHVLEDETFPTRPPWIQANCCVLTWIYGTVSGDLQQSLMMRQGTARHAWCYLEDEFLSQKESRALLLETRFRNFRQDSLSITDYCRRLESMATSLAEFGDPIGDRQMVLTPLRALSGKFRHMVSILKMHRPFPTFTEAQTHLLLEELEIDACPPSPPAALIAATPHPAAPSATAPPRQGTVPPPRPNAPTSVQRNGRRRGRGGRNSPSTNNSGAPSAPTASVPYGGQGGSSPGTHPSFAHPWAGTMRMWPYNPTGRPTPPPAFHAVPHYGGFGGPPFGAPPPQYDAYYGGATPPVF
ncbi:uncharacterized protein [Miscanthus floridulus]|uniref:uncharacterized protein n=1 Tax=Miscanthus floridulus TaxID=154761 RepID=UPI0034577320